jgi:hypothetical protein
MLDWVDGLRYWMDPSDLCELDTTSTSETQLYLEGILHTALQRHTLGIQSTTASKTP